MANFSPSSGLFLTALLISCVLPSTGNTDQSKADAKNGIGGARSASQAKPEQNDKLGGLKNYTNTIDWTQQNDEVKQVIAGLLQGIDMDALLSLVGGGFGDIFSGNSSVFDSMKEVFNSSEVQERIYAMKVVVDVLMEESVYDLEISQSCYSEVKTMLEGLLGGKDWAVRMFDAFGKPGSELKNYQLRWLGSYDECLAVKTGQASSAISGKYCTLIVKFEQGQLPFRPEIKSGICVPSSCAGNDVKGLLQAVVSLATKKKSELETVDIYCQETIPVDAATITGIVILTILGLIMAIGTLYDVLVIQMKWPYFKTEDSDKKIPLNDIEFINEPATFKVAPPAESTDDSTVAIKTTTNEHDPTMGESRSSLIGIEAGTDDMVLEEVHQNTEHVVDKSEANGDHKGTGGKAKLGTLKGILKKLLLSFSVYKNGKRILSTTHAPGSFGAIHGIRFLSMAWIILGHTYFFGMGHFENVWTFYLQQIYNWPMMAIMNANVSVDTFFAVGGLLVSYLTLKELKKVGSVRRFKWWMFYLHRFVRLTPTHMMVVFLWASVVKNMASGPLSNMDMTIYDNCKYYWWTNLLYINNVYHLDKQCIGWTWYLSCDMQFYLLSPLMLIPLFCKVKVGVIVTLVFYLLSTGITALRVASNHYPAQALLGLKGDDDQYHGKVYIPFYTRMGSYIVGLLTGYLLYRLKCKCHIPKKFVLLGWALSILICIAVVYGTYSDKDRSHIMGTAESTIYLAYHRTGWALAVCWIVFACATGHGGWINTLLSWRAFIPLGRLTYCAYLIHPVVQLVYYWGRQRLLYISNYEVVYMFLSHLVLSYGIAFIVSLAVEAPMMAIEKIIFKREKQS